MMTIAMCDDNPLYLTQLEKIILKLANEHAVEVNLIRFSSGEALVEFFIKNPYIFDMIFLDVYMDGMTGIDAATIIRKTEKTVPIVFLTSSKEHAVESYRLAAFDYLLKPYNLEKIGEVFAKLLDYKQEIKKQTILVKNGQNLYTIDLRKVVYFESSLRTITVHFNDEQTVTFYQKMDELEQKLISQHFIRTHRSYLVNLLYVRNIIQTDVETMYDQLLPISKKYLKDTKNRFTDYICEF